MGRLPNFLYIGTSKAGSTWLYHVLDRHPDVYMAPGKGLHFFDNRFECGLEWYQAHFAGASGEKIVGEVSHSYLYSAAASERMTRLDQNMQLMVCLREPAERAFSDYLDRIKNGSMACSFEDALQQVPELIERGRYAKYLAPYVEQFGRAGIHVGKFDELSTSPNEFALKLFRFLDVEQRELREEQKMKMMPAAQPRSKVLASMAKSASHTARSLGLRKLRGRVKTSRFIRSVLYREYKAAEKPTMQWETRERLKDTFRGEIEQLDSLVGTDFGDSWGYH